MLKYLAMLILPLCGTPAWADAASDCGQKEDQDLRIRGCTQLIQQNRDPKLMAGAYANRGLGYRYKGEYDRAIADYNRAIKIDPKAPVYNNRGWAYYQKGDYDRAISDASVAISIDPKYKFSYHTRGEAYRAKGAYDRALSDFNQALSLDPTHLAAVVSLGMTYDAMGDRKKAIENYSRSQSLPATTKDAKEYQAEASNRLAAIKNTPTVTALPATTPNAMISATGRRIALLIGNQFYTEKVGPLKNPHSDVALLEAALKKVGFDVVVLRDTNYRSLDLAIKRHISKVRDAGRDAISFFYYSGHGASNPVTHINYLIPVDVADAETDDFWNQAFELNDIVDKLSTQTPDATNYVVFDACRDELKVKQSGKSLGSTKGFAPITNTSGLLIAYATAPNKTASDVGAGSGPYARALAEEIVKPGQEAVTMFRNVQLKVKAAIKLHRAPPRRNELAVVVVDAAPTTCGCEKCPGAVAVKINDRDARRHDLYRIDLATGQRTLLWENTNELLDIHLDWHLRPRHARSNAMDGGSRLWRIEGTTLMPWRDVPYEDMLTTWAGLFHRCNERVLLLTSAPDRLESHAKRRSQA
jgi:tetratricopeptide (TPR) repeat protein